MRITDIRYVITSEDQKFFYSGEGEGKVFLASTSILLVSEESRTFRSMEIAEQELKNLNEMINGRFFRGFLDALTYKELPKMEFRTGTLVIEAELK